jgi:hypothetical protein
MAFLAPLAFGTAATAATAGTAATAATAGLFGAGGSFAIGQTLATIGTGLGVAGAVRAGQAASMAGQYNAESARMEGAVREAAQRQQSGRQLGAIRAGISKSGATMEGTPLMVLAESAANAEIDALNTRFTAGREATLSTMRGQEGRRAAYWSAGTSLLTGLSRIA